MLPKWSDGTGWKCECVLVIKVREHSWWGGHNELISPSTTDLAVAIVESANTEEKKQQRMVEIIHTHWSCITVTSYEYHGVSNHRRLDCLLNHLFSRRSKKTSKRRFTGLCEGNSPVTGEFPAQKASSAEIVSIWWRHHGKWVSLR